MLLISATAGAVLESLKSDHKQTVQLHNLGVSTGSLIPCNLFQAREEILNVLFSFIKPPFLL